jgi:hypothetical protein
MKEQVRTVTLILITVSLALGLLVLTVPLKGVIVP